jgi:hypothetical protein
MCLIRRRERPQTGAKLSISEAGRHRIQCLIADQEEEDIAILELRHREHAQVEDALKGLKATGALYLPLRSSQANAAWF